MSMKLTENMNILSKKQAGSYDWGMRYMWRGRGNLHKGCYRCVEVKHLPNVIFFSRKLLQTTFDVVQLEGSYDPWI